MSKPKPRFWLRYEPEIEFDIARLRPPSLPRGKRFETLQDAKDESLRSEAVLRRAGAGSAAEYLNDCRLGAYDCEKSFCPVCARNFRRWYTGQMLKETVDRRTHVVTVLLDKVGRGELTGVTLTKHRSVLRKRLRKTVSDANVIGCFEMVYKARQKVWVLHINLLIIGAKQKDVDAFRAEWRNSSLERPIMAERVRNRAEQISYVPKFGTYHRPYAQGGPTKSPAKSLNPREHKELVQWMSQFDFQDLMFLHNSKRMGSEIKLRG